MPLPSRNESLSLLRTFTKSESLLHHALAVEGVMRHYAGLLGEDEEFWARVGLLHDLDWESFPDQHCSKTSEILREAGYPERFIRAVRSHAWGMFTDDKPDHIMEKVLYAIDELTGLITATALVRPSKSVLDMQSKSVKKKWKDKAFAAGANRDVILKGIEMMGHDRDSVIDETLRGMQRVADAIGLGSCDEGRVKAAAQES